MENAFLKKFTEIAEAHLSDPQFSVEVMAREMGMSYSSLRRRISSYTGKTANQLIREIRLNKAFEILKNESVTMSEVAYRTGFNSPNYFNTCFHEHFGYPPGEISKNGGQPLPIKTIPQKNRCKGPLKILITVLLIVGGIILFTGIKWNGNGRKSIAVLPVSSLNQYGNLQSFCDGLRETLFNGLSEMDLFNVVSKLSADQFKNHPIPSMKEVGRKLNADYILDLKVWEREGKYQISAKLYESHSDRQIWSQESHRFKSRDFETQQEVVEDMKSGIKKFFINNEKAIREGHTYGVNPSDSCVQMGNYYSDPKRFEPAEALKSYREAARLNPQLAEAHIGIARVLNQLYMDFESRRDTQLTGIIQAIQKADQLKPRLSASRDQEALYFSNQREFGKALAACSLALSANPESPESFYLLAGALMGQGQWPKAIECLDQVIDKHFFSVPHTSRLAQGYDHLRDYKHAARYYHDAIGLYPVNEPAMIGLVGISLKTLGNPVKAMALLDSLVIRTLPPKKESRSEFQRALIEFYDGRYQDAFDRLARWSRVLPPGPSGYCRPRYLVMAEACGLMHKTDLERKYYDSTRIYLEALQGRSVANLNDPYVNGALGVAWAGLGNRTKALACAEKVMALLAAKPDAFLGPYAMEDVALIYARTGDTWKAREILKKLLSEPGPLTLRMLALDPRWRELHISSGVF
jgi:AraC-like DNA-binding protein/tetratricopeptide (TPR) repeat protein